MLIRLAAASILNRKLTVLLTVLSIAISVSLLLGIEHIRSEVKASFSKTVSGVDLIVGARTGPLNLLLYSVFHIGSASNTISWQSYQELSARPEIAWSIPIALGDSHKGYRVMGTTPDYFRHFRYGKKQNLSFEQGHAFAGVYEAVVGAEVAKNLNYDLDQNMVLAHGIGPVSFKRHDDNPFTIIGILKPTGTPVDRMIYVSLAGIEAIHADWHGGVHSPDPHTHLDSETDHESTPQTITAFMVGLKSRIALFGFQRIVNTYSHEPLLAILPGVTLTDLWQMARGFENILQLISLLVLIATLLGLTTLLLTSMKEREREITVLRALGAHAWTLFLLIEAEALMITLLGIAVGSSILAISLTFAKPWLGSQYGLFISSNPVTGTALIFFAGILVLSALLGLIPSVLVYRKSLGHGLS